MSRDKTLNKLKDLMSIPSHAELLMKDIMADYKGASLWI
jgi:hypothetical protein